MNTRLGISASVAVLICVSTARADVLACEGLPLTVTAPTLALAERTCRAAGRVVPVMAECGVALSQMQDVELVHSIPGSPGCMGIYHCGENRIEVLLPQALERARGDDGAFRSVPTPSYFESVLAHELAHAAYDAVPCPFRDCLVTSEYVAYSMQVYTLPPTVRHRFQADMDPEARVSRYDMNSIGLLMDPGRFARNVWAHFSQRQDGCAYVADIMRAKFHLDTERPEP